MRKTIEKHLDELKEEGYTIVKAVLKKDEVSDFLNNSKGICSRRFKPLIEIHDNQETPKRSKRKRSGIQQWKGAINSISAHMKHNGQSINIISPLAIRSKGRFDLPLPSNHKLPSTMIKVLEASKVLEILESYVKNGSIATQNVLLSQKGSIRQPIHTDHYKNGYATALIPLITQTSSTGGTRLFPKSHKKKGFDPETAEFIDCVSPMVEKGDCIIFDGQLMHCGMENNSKEDRYFYYSAFCKGHDFNTDATQI